MARNVPCGLRSRLGLEVLEETREDAEVRVAAYLSVVQCADHDVMTHIRRLLANEPINQGTVRRRPFHSPSRRGFYGFFYSDADKVERQDRPYCPFLLAFASSAKVALSCTWI